MSLGVLQGCRCYDVSIDVDRDNTFKTYGTTLDIGIPMGPTKLQSLTATVAASRKPLRTSTAHLSSKETLITRHRPKVRLRRVATDFRIRRAAHMLLGLYFEKSRRGLTVDRQWPDFIGYSSLFNGTVIFATGTVDTTAYAAYAEATYSFSDAWDLDVGGRYSKRRRNARAAASWIFQAWAGSWPTCSLSTRAHHLQIFRLNSRSVFIRVATRLCMARSPPGSKQGDLLRFRD